MGCTWQDTSPAGCTTQPNTYPTVTITLGLGVNCNTVTEAPATFNGQSLSTGLNLGNEYCNCNERGALESFGPFTSSAYVLGGTNTITFYTPVAIGFTPDASGIFARIIVTGS